MVRLVLSAVAAASLVVACTPAEQAMMRLLGPHPVTDGGSFSTGGGLTVAAEIVPIDGMTGLCGVWSESKRQAIFSRGTAGKVMHTGSAYLDGEVLHRDLAFMRQVPPQTSYAGQEAACIRTARPWTGAEGALQLRLPRQVVHREIEDDGSASVEVVFTQDGPGALNPSLKSLVFGE